MNTFATADGAELSYEERGPRGALSILFLHGWFGSARVWKPVIDRLADHRRTIAVDFRGFGASSDAPGPYRVQNFTDDLSALIANLDLDPSIVVGHSMGAAVAQRFAIDRPEAVEGLVLVSPVPAGGMRFPPKLDAYFRSLPGNLEATHGWLDLLTHGEPAPDVRQALRDAASRVPPAVALESYDSWSTLDFEDEARTIATPALVIATEHDRPDFARERVAQIIGGSRFKLLPGAGHYPLLEAPAAVASAIDAFIEEL